MECSLLFGQPHYSHCAGLSQSCKVMNTLHKMLHLYDNLVTTLQGKNVVNQRMVLSILYKASNLLLNKVATYRFT